MSFGSFPTRYETVGYLKSSVFSKIGWAAVDVVSGEFVNSTVDISMKGPYGFEFKRHYGLVRQKGGKLGSSWRHNYSMRLSLEDGIIIYNDWQGNYTVFEELESGKFKNIDKPTWNISVEQEQYILNTGGTVNTVFNKEGMPVALVNICGYRQDISYNGSIIEKITDSLGRALLFDYYADTLLKAVECQVNNNKKHKTEYDYDQGMLAGVRQNNRRISYSYSDSHLEGRIVSIKDVDNTTLNITYDSNGRVSECTFEEGFARKTFKYNLKNRITTVGLSGGDDKSYSYNVHGYITGISFEQEVAWKYTWSTSGNLLSIAGPQGNTLNYNYDHMSRVLSIENKDGSNLSCGYDQDGRIGEISSQGEKASLFEYSDTSKSYSITDPAGRITRLESNQHGMPEIIKLPNGTSLEFVYDGNGNVLKRKTPEGLCYSYEYDSANNLVKIIRPDNTFIEYGYNEDNLQTFMRTSSGREIKYTYDDAGNITCAQGKDSSTVLEYDCNGFVTKCITKAKFDKTGYEYAAEIGYEYDQGGRLIKITDGKSKISYKYKTPLKYSIKMDNQKELVCLFDVSNKQSSILFPNKRKSISKRNPSGLVSEIAEYQDDNLLAKKVFEYDQKGLKKLLKTDGFEYAYSYDAVQRVVSVSSKKEGETTTKTLEEFEYDVSDNIVRHTKKCVLANYSYLKGTLLENAGDSVCKYDEAGRLAAILFKNGESYTYIYDEFDRLLSVVKEREGKAADSFDFYYDCFGRRIGQCINQNTTAFVYAGGVLLGEVDEKASIDTRYCIDIVSGRPMMFAKEGQYYCYHTDEQMSVCSVTDQNGNVVNNYSYDLFGGFKDKKESVFQRLGYTGCEYVPQLGIYNMRFRSYLPDLFRFMTPDPSGVRDSYNPYCYTANNPVNMTDQSGLSGGGQGAGGSTNYDGSKINEQEYTDRKATFRDEVAIFTLISTSLTTGFILAIPSASKALGATTVVITGTVAVSASTIVAFVGLAAGIIGTAWWIWPDWNDGIGSSSSSPSRPINYDRPIWGADYIMYHGMPIYK